MINHDYILKKVLFRKDGHIESNRLRKITLKKYPNILNYLIFRFNDSHSIKESIARIKFNIKVKPICPICGNPVNYCKISNNRIIWTQFCSKKCSYIGKVEIRKKTNLEKYGVENPAQNKEIKEKIKKTNLKKYGVSCVFKNEKIKERIKETNITKYGTESCLQNKDIYNKTIQTLKDRYGVKHALENRKILEKAQNTTLKHYGVKTVFKLKEIQEKTKTKEAKDKIIETKRRNHTFNTSKPEENLYKVLTKLYGVESVKRQYKSDLYPWSCDFYIVPINTYIELQGYWTHNTHPFNINNDNDVKQLNEWKEKTTQLYKNAVKVWTVSDVDKRNTAITNNLNYIEIFNYISDENIINELQNYHRGYLVI